MERNDLRFARLSMDIVSLFYDGSKGPLKLKDFILDYEPREAQPEVQQTELAVAALNAWITHTKAVAANKG